MGLFDIFRTKSSTQGDLRCLAQYETNLNQVKGRKRQDILKNMGLNDQLIVEPIYSGEKLCLSVKSFNKETIGTIPPKIVSEIEQNYSNNFNAKISRYKIYNSIEGIYECSVWLQIF